MLVTYLQMGVPVDAVEHISLAAAQVRVVAGEQRVQDHPHGPDVTLLAVGALTEDLRRCNTAPQQLKAEG